MKVVLSDFFFLEQISSYYKNHNNSWDHNVHRDNTFPNYTIIDSGMNLFHPN